MAATEHISCNCIHCDSAQLPSQTQTVCNGREGVDAHGTRVLVSSSGLPRQRIRQLCEDGGQICSKGCVGAKRNQDPGHLRNCVVRHYCRMYIVLSFRSR